MIVLTLLVVCSLAAGQATGQKPPQEAGFWQQLLATGVVGAVLAAVSIISLSVGIERFISFRKSNVAPRPVSYAIQQAAQLSEVQKICTGDRSILARAITLCKPGANLSAAQCEKQIEEFVGRLVERQTQKAYPLAVAATVSPLMGLFGTVFGMVKAFESIALSGEMGNASLLAHHISYALMTTVLGLIVAIPSLLMYHFFKMRVATFTLDLEEVLSLYLQRLHQTPSEQQ